MTGPTWRLFPTGDLSRHAARLFDQQMWLLGRDVARPGGNLLTALGLCRARSPFPSGSTRYTAQSRDGGTVAVWAFGSFFGDPAVGGVFVRRGGFHPVYSPDAEPPFVWVVADLPRLARPSSAREWAAVRELVRRLIGWFAHYEHWVGETLGPDYRERCLSGWDKKVVAAAGETAAAWERLGKKCGRIGHYSGGTSDPLGRFAAGLRPSARSPVRVGPRFRFQGTPALRGKV